MVVASSTPSWAEVVEDGEAAGAGDNGKVLAAVFTGADGACHEVLEQARGRAMDALSSAKAVLGRPRSCGRWRASAPAGRSGMGRMTGSFMSFSGKRGWADGRAPLRRPASPREGPAQSLRAARRAALGRGLVGAVTVEKVGTRRSRQGLPLLRRTSLGRRARRSLAPHRSRRGGTASWIRRRGRRDLCGSRPWLPA